VSEINKEVNDFVDPIKVASRKIIEEMHRSHTLVAQREHEIAENVIRNINKVLMGLDAVSHLTGSEVACIATGLEKGMRAIYKEITVSKMSQIDALLSEFEEVKEERENAEEEAMSCQNRLDEIKKELEELGYTGEVRMQAF